jgi:WhiB family redox-sensing transcriptional regulator
MTLLNLRADPNAWRERAACLGDMAAAFYPPLRPENRSVKHAREQQAKALCASCVVRENCLDQALAQGERYGIWGGLTDTERRHLRAS